jgi:hypothetical protein
MGVLLIMLFEATAMYSIDSLHGKYDMQ